jgi:hypothetical protein
MPEINGIEFGAISFSEGMNDGLADAFPTPPAETDPAIRFQEPDTAPIEHNSILDTPVTMPDPPKAKRKTAIRTQLEGMYATAGMMLLPFDPQTAMVIAEQGPACAQALDDLAQKNPKFKESLESMLATSAWSAVIMAHLPILVTVGTKYVPELKRRYMATTEAHDSAAA